MSAARLVARSLGRQQPRLTNFRKPIVPLSRTLATPVQTSRYADPVTHTSTLSNGFSVSSETIPGMSTSTVALYIDAGSRADSMNASGAAHFLEHLAFKGTNKRSQNQIELEVENTGATLNAYTSREQTGYQAHCFDKDAGQMVEIIADMALNSKIEGSAVEREKGVILREAEDVAANTAETIFDHLHSIAFQRQPLGNSILGPEEHIRKMTRENLTDYIKTNYTADRMCLVGAGGISHEELVKLAEKNFASVPVSSNPIPLGGISREKPHFSGAEIRVRDDDMNNLHIAIAVEAVGWRSPDYWPFFVLSSIFGNWDRGLGASPLLSSKLSHIVSSNNLANSFQHFYSTYNDTGLWGVYLITENLSNVDDLVHFTLKEWTRMSIAPTLAEVERAKSQAKAGLLLSLDGTFAIADDIGRQMVSTGKRFTPKEVERYIDAVTPEDIKRVALKYLWDKDIALAAIGRTDGLLDYSRIRADMSSMVY